LKRHQLTLLEPFKTVLVEDVRSMAVMVLGREMRYGGSNGITL
jgi:hypothetical protein